MNTELSKKRAPVLSRSSCNSVTPVCLYWETDPIAKNLSQIGFIEESEYPEKTGDIWWLHRWLESEQSQKVLNHKNNSRIWKIRACEVWLTKQGFYSAQSVWEALTTVRPRVTFAMRDLSHSVFQSNMEAKFKIKVYTGRGKPKIRIERKFGPGWREWRTLLGSLLYRSQRVALRRERQMLAVYL